MSTQFNLQRACLHAAIPVRGDRCRCWVNIESELRDELPAGKQVAREHEPNGAPLTRQNWARRVRGDALQYDTKNVSVALQLTNYWCLGGVFARSTRWKAKLECTDKATETMRRDRGAPKQFRSAKRQVPSSSLLSRACSNRAEANSI